jgi:hypothetical protein
MPIRRRPTAVNSKAGRADSWLDSNRPPDKLVGLTARHTNLCWDAGHHLRVFGDPSSVTVMASDAEFQTGDLAEVLSGPFRRRLSVVLHRYEESELWMVAIYYPSESCFVHTYLNKEQLKIIGHLEGV